MSKIKVQEACFWEKEYKDNICTYILSRNCGKKCDLKIQRECILFSKVIEGKIND